MRRPPHSPRRGLPRAHALLALATGCGVCWGLAACAGDEPAQTQQDASVVDIPTDAGADVSPDPENDAAGPSPETDAGPAQRYALVTQMLTEDAVSSRVLVTDSLTGTVALDGALTIPGHAIGFGPHTAGELFVGSDTAPTLTRYTLRSDDILEAQGSIDFAEHGITSIAEHAGQLHFVSATKAYYIDTSTPQLVVWNPSSLTTTFAVALEDLTVDGAQLSVSTDPLRVGDQLITFAAWQTLGAPGIVPRAAVIAIDTSTDTVRIASDDRCGFARDGALGADGKVYLATQAYGTAAHRLGHAPAPCFLRYDPATASFDVDYYRAAQVSGGRLAGSLVRGPADSVFLRWLDETAVTVHDGLHPRSLVGASAWGWATLVPGEAMQSTVIDEALRMPGSSPTHRLGALVFVADLSSDGATTALRELTTSGPAANALTVPGHVHSAVQLR